MPHFKIAFESRGARPRGLLLTCLFVLLAGRPAPAGPSTPRDGGPDAGDQAGYATAPPADPGWPGQYSPPKLARSDPTIDPALLAWMDGLRPAATSRPPQLRHPAALPDLAASPLLGDILRKGGEDAAPPAPSRGTPGSIRPWSAEGGAPTTAPAPVTAGSSRTSAAAAANGATPTAPSSDDERRLDGLYRRSDPTRGWTGPRRRYRYTAVDAQSTSTDRWRQGFPDYVVHTRGDVLDPYEQNVLKGDYPIAGNRTFLDLTLKNDTLFEFRDLPTPSNAAARAPGSYTLFGRPHQYAFRENLSASVELFEGDTAFEPPRWRVRLTPVWNVDNTLRLAELGDVVPDVRYGLKRVTDDGALEEAFVEGRLAVLSPYFDFMSVRIGRQPFRSDFRGFIFDDTNSGIRLFGNGSSNRTQFNLVYFDMTEQDSNSDLLRDTFKDRGQQVYIANIYRQDFLGIPGYTQELSYHRDIDHPAIRYDNQGFLLRPDPLGELRPHEVRANYVGLAGDGHIGRFNVDDAVYDVYGEDTFNGIAGQSIHINAQMAALELSYDFAWLRLKASGFYASGDNNPLGRTGRGFDSILDRPNFAGGDVSFWNRQGIGIVGVGLTQRESLVPDLRSSKTEGQANFVNPGLILYNAGADADITPKVKASLNLNILSFHHTAPIELILFQGSIPRYIGFDYSLGLTYRPHLNENIVLRAGLAGFSPGDGFQRIFDVQPSLAQEFLQVDLTY